MPAYIYEQINGSDLKTILKNDDDDDDDGGGGLPINIGLVLDEISSTSVKKRNCPLHIVTVKFGIFVKIGTGYS